MTLWLASAALMIACFPKFALAQAQNPMPPDSLVMSPGGVDMRSLRYMVDAEDLSIGDPDNGGLSFRRTAVNIRPTLLGNDSLQSGTMGQFSDSWDVGLRQLSRGIGNGYDISISDRGIAANFFSYDLTSFTPTSAADIGSLSRVGVGSQMAYQLETKEGTVVTFMPSGTGTLTALPIKIRQANGTTFTFTYATNRRRVVSNRGYALLMETSSSRVVKACVLNLTVQALPPGDTCPAIAPTTSYTYSGDFLTSVTAVDKTVWNVTNTLGSSSSTSPFNMSFYKPVASTPYMTLHYSFVSNHRIVTSQDFADGRHYDYGYRDFWYGEVNGTNAKAEIVGHSYTLNNNATTITEFSYFWSDPTKYAPVISPGPSIVQDPLSRQTISTYCLNCIPARLDSRKLPLGGTETYSYDVARNLTKIVKVPSQGSSPSLADITQSFSHNLSAPVSSRSKPTSVTDGNQNVTSYTYDPVHGGLKTETLPAVVVNGSGSVQPVKRFDYTYRKAWVANGSGGYVQNTDGIYLLASEKTCRSTATVGNSCAGGASDEVVTSYDYGPDSGPNNLQLRRKTVTAMGSLGTIESRSTCFGYDANGKKIWETMAKGVCP